MASSSLECKLRPNDPEALAATQAAGDSPDLHKALHALTSDQEMVRGCMVNPERGHLQALQNMVGWTIGGYDTRPVPEAADQKQKDRLQILLSYRQPQDTGGPPTIRMYDYLCDTLFRIPMRPVDPEIIVPDFLDLEGNLVKGNWQEADFSSFQGANALPRPGPFFGSNRYPYQLPDRQLGPEAHELQRKAQHWLLWYLHFPWEAVASFPDETIDKDVRAELLAVVSKHGFDRVDYILYRNPSASVPEMFHVQVFWIIPDSASIK